MGHKDGWAAVAGLPPCTSEAPNALVCLWDKGLELQQAPT